MAKEPKPKPGWIRFPSLTREPAGSGAGPPLVFEATVLIHLDAAYTLARYLTRRSDAADDIVQEALLRAYRGFENQRGDNIRAWLLTIVRNCFFTWNERHNQRHEESFEYEDGSIGDNHEDHVTPESILIRHQTGKAVRAEVERLPQPFREVLVLRDIEDLSYREIADITGVPIGTVMSRLARARKMFATAWNGSEMKVPEEKR